MELHYISDEQGRHTAVVIPIHEWDAITAKHQELKQIEKPKQKVSDFVGCISKDTAQQMITDIESSRTEWERTI